MWDQRTGLRRAIRLEIHSRATDSAPRLTAAAVLGLVAAGLLAAFGMPPVNLHTPLHFMGIMDPACGMTRGVAAAARGDLREAWWYNPASPLVVVGGLAVVARWVVGRLTGWWVDARLQATRLTLVVVAVVGVVLEVNQQMHVDRLR